MPGVTRELNSHLLVVVSELNEVLDRATRIRTEWQRSGYYPFGITATCHSTKIIELLKPVQSLQNDLQLINGNQIRPPLGAPAPHSGGGRAFPARPASFSNSTPPPIERPATSRRRPRTSTRRSPTSRVASSRKSTQAATLIRKTSSMD